VALLVITTHAFGPLCNNFTRPSPIRLPSSGSAAGTRVAFLGDQGISQTSTRGVLEMIKEWGADPFVILGDFDYVNSPSRWQQLLDEVLGPDYPILAIGGNHDVPQWNGYRQVIQANMARSGLSQYCTGTLGVDMACNYKGIFFLLNQVGTQGNINNYVTSARNVLQANVGERWKFCGWHKNQHVYQTGDKNDETGYAILDTCRQYGAAVITGHEHSYARSVLMSDYAEQEIVQPIQDEELHLSLGESFVVCTGLGGKDIRAWRNGAQNNPWWASCAASNNGVDYGALLCEFEEDHADCRQVDISGTTWDRFTIYPLQVSNNATVPEPKCSTPFFEIGVEEDLHETTSRLVNVDAQSFSLTEYGQTIAFRFTNVELSVYDKIQTAHLQVFGFDSAPGIAVVSIRAEISPDSQKFGTEAPMNGITSRKFTTNTVTWTKHDGENEWEDGEVWVSPNIKSILDEIVAQPGWKAGNAITLFVTGTGAPRRVYTRDSGDCLAPTLSIELETQCK